MMKKLFAVLTVLCLCGAANAASTISLVDEGRAIPIPAGGVVRLDITSDVGLSAFNCIVVLTGDGFFSDAMHPGPIIPYGWDTVMEPIYYNPKRVEIGGGGMENVYGVCGWVEVTYSGPIYAEVSLEGDGTRGGSYGADYWPATYSTGLVGPIPEPAAIVLLGLGALAMLRRLK